MKKDIKPKYKYRFRSLNYNFGYGTAYEEYGVDPVDAIRRIVEKSGKFKECTYQEIRGSSSYRDYHEAGDSIVVEVYGRYISDSSLSLGLPGFTMRWHLTDETWR